MLNLDDTAILRKTLPSSIAEDQTVQDICDSVQPQLSKACLDIASVLLLPNLDNLSEALVDELVWQFHVDFYRDNYPIETKRKLVRTAIERHRIKGTPAVVEEVIRTVYQYAKIEEWFEYNGNPYCFRVLMSAKDPAPPLTIGDVVALIDEYKSLRSHLDGIYYWIPHDLVIKTSFNWVCYYGRVAGTYPYRRRYGLIEDPALIIETAKGGILYQNPYTNESVAGTFPSQATEGDLIDNDLVVQTDKGGLLYRNPFTDELVAGTFPEPVMQGDISADGIPIETAKGNMLYKTPHTNESVSGTFPDVVSAGSIDGDGITANTAAGDISYSARFCGSTPGGLF